MADPFRRAGVDVRPARLWADRSATDPSFGGEPYRHVGAAPEVCIPPRAHVEPPNPSEPTVAQSPQWKEEYKEASRQLAVMVKMSLDMIDLRGQVATLTREVVGVKLAAPGSIVPVQSFAPEPYEVHKQFSVVVKQVDDGYMACFPDANLTTYGDNEQEAVENLKGMILDTFEKFTSGRKLGPAPAKQLAVLREFIRVKG